MKKIAIISSLNYPTNNNAPGGQEVWTADITLELARRGWNIDLFATRGSIVEKNIRLQVITQTPLYALGKTHKELKKKLPDIRKVLYSKIVPQLISNDYDLILDSTREISFSLIGDLLKKPIIVIGHHPVDKLYTSIFKYLPQPANLFFVFPSKFQEKNAFWLKNKSVIPHGIPVNNFHFQHINKIKAGFWVGRVPEKDEKGLMEAIELFTHLKLPLEYYPMFDNKTLFEEKINPDMKSYTSEKNHYEKFNSPGKYKLLIYPLKWDEPFGLVLIEAMACGTPVVAYAKGSVPEIINDGETGFIINSSNDDMRGIWTIKETGTDGLSETVNKIVNMPENEYLLMRKKCRERAEKYFSTSIMVDQYEDLFNKIKLI